MGAKKSRQDGPQAQVRLLIKKGKLKGKCCRSKKPCKRCPVLALKRARVGEIKAA